MAASDVGGELDRGEVAGNVDDFARKQCAGRDGDGTG